MKLLVFIAILMCLLVIFYCVCKMLDPTLTVEGMIKGIKEFFRPAPAPRMTPIDLYAEQQVNYKNFATIVWNCLYQVGGRCKLSVPARPDGIYALEVTDRVNVDGGIFTFSYEVEREAPNYDGGLKKAAAIPVTDMERILSNNLPGHLRGGYCYNGEIHVWDRENNAVLIEVHGISRTYQIIGDFAI